MYQPHTHISYPMIASMPVKCEYTFSEIIKNKMIQSQYECKKEGIYLYTWQLIAPNVS